MADVPVGEVLGTQQTLMQLVKVGVIALPYLASEAYFERSFLCQGYQAIRG
jgi:hypothetical protein